MTTLDVIKEAIIALGDRTGSSVPAIAKWLEANKKVCLLLSLGVYTPFCGHVVSRRLGVFAISAQKSTRAKLKAARISRSGHVW